MTEETPVQCIEGKPLNILQNTFVDKGKVVVSINFGKKCHFTSVI